MDKIKQRAFITEKITKIMKDNYLGSLFIAISIGTLIFFAGAHACESYPFLARWVGGECWFESSSEEDSSLAKENLIEQAEGLYLQAKSFQGAPSDDEVTKAAIYALAQNGSDKAIAALQNLARTHKSIEIRKAALYALAQCSSSDKLRSFYKEFVEVESELELRKAAIYALGQMGDLEAVNILEAMATSSHHVSLRKAAVYALQNSNAEPAQQALYRILSKLSDSL